MREFINKHGTPVAVIALLLAAVAVYFFGRPRPAPNLNRAFFVDEGTGEEQVLPLTEYPPRLNKSGKPSLVQEIKFTCDGGKTVKIAYYLKYSDNAKAALDKIMKDTGKPAGIDVTAGTYVRAPQKGSQWFLSGTADAAPLQQLTCPSGGEIEMILP